MQSKILIIEDNKDVRENIEELLQLSGYEVFTAENGKLGTSKALETTPDLILCDIMMRNWMDLVYYAFCLITLLLWIFRLFF